MIRDDSSPQWLETYLLVQRNEPRSRSQQAQNTHNWQQPIVPKKLLPFLDFRTVLSKA